MNEDGSYGFTAVDGSGCLNMSGGTAANGVNAIVWGCGQYNNEMFDATISIPEAPQPSPSPSASSTPKPSPSVTSTPTPTPSPSVTPTPTGPQTWYIRKDGGARYSAARITAGLPAQCDGLGDAPYPGTGVNQHCAYNDYRFLWDDQTYGNWSLGKWVIKGGDTVIVHAGQYRVGFDTDGTTGNDPWCFGGNGPYSCGSPTIPAGTQTQPTRILGENYQACTQQNMTQLFGGHGVGVVVNLSGAQYVQVECLEISRFGNCARHGDSPDTTPCSTGNPISEYDSEGITTDVNTHDILLQDLWIHGHTDRGIIGPIGGIVSANRVDIAYNAMAGWDFDDGSATPMAPGAFWEFTNSIIEWNGCNQENPMVDPIPVISCSGQSDEGYGDGVGTPAGTGLSANIDHSIFRYNTQDGLDLGHVDTGGPYTLSITNSQAYGNNGGTFKMGAQFATETLENNFMEANCERMAAPMVGAPPTYNAHLGDFCRAGDATSFNFQNFTTVNFINNTLVGYAPTMLDLGCWDTSGACPSAVLNFKNNIVAGYNDPAAGDYGGNSGPGLFYFQEANVVGNFHSSNNLYYGVPHGSLNPTLGFSCPNTEANGDICNVSPGFVGQPAGTGTTFVETELDNFNANLSPTSPAIGTGIAIQGLTLDFNGNPYGNPPVIGAFSNLKMSLKHKANKKLKVRKPKAKKKPLKVQKPNGTQNKL